MKKKKKKEYGVCLSVVERGAEASEQEREGAALVFCVTERRVGEGKGGREIMRAREQTVASHCQLTDSYSLCIVCVCVRVSRRRKKKTA